MPDKSESTETEAAEPEESGRDDEGLRGGSGGSDVPGFMKAFFTGIFIVLTCLTMAGAVLASWIHYTALDTARFVEAVAPLVKNPEVDKAISREAVNRLFERFDLTRRIEQEIQSLPEPLKSQAERGAAGARNLAQILTAQVLKSGPFQKGWREILSTAHSEAIQGIGENGPVRVNEQGEVVLDVSLLLTSVKDRLASNGFEFLKNLDIPSGLGRIVLYKNSQLGNIKKIVNTLDDFFLVLPFGAVVLLILASFVADDTRRTVIRASVGIIIVLAALVIGLKGMQYHYINPISDLTNRGAAMAAASRLQGGLDLTALGIIILSILTVVAGVVAGPDSRIRRRTRMAPQGRGLERRHTPAVVPAVGACGGCRCHLRRVLAQPRGGRAPELRTGPRGYG